MKRKLEQVFVCEKSKNPIVQGFFRRGGVQKRRTLIVSKLESFYGTSVDNGLSCIMKDCRTHILVYLRDSSIALIISVQLVYLLSMFIDNDFIITDICISLNSVFVSRRNFSGSPPVGALPQRR